MNEEMIPCQDLTQDCNTSNNTHFQTILDQHMNRRGFIAKTTSGAMALAFAATVSASKTTMEVVDRSICEINIKDLGHFQKELTEFHSNSKDVVLTLTVENTATQETVSKPVEIFLVLDN